MVEGERKTVAQTSTSKFAWIKNPSKKRNTITLESNFSDPPSELVELIDYFKKYFTDNLIAHIVQQTNLYAAQVGSSFVTNEEEIEQYIGILVKMGIVHMPRYELYWSVELRYPPIADVMTRDRFKDLNRFVHFNDNALATQNRDDPAYDRYYKVRPLLNMLRDACLLTEPEERMSVNEQMIPYKGKNSLRQYLQKNRRSGALK